MVAKNMKELEQMLLKEMKKAMSVTSKKISEDMYDETGNFYTKGKPQMYERTGALGDTPKTTEIFSVGNTVSFKAYLDTSSKYTTGDNPSMEQVLDLANYGKPWVTKGGQNARPTLGNQGFWDRAEDKMQVTFDRTMKQFFK